jgi:putative transcriptional regulator
MSRKKIIDGLHEALAHAHGTKRGKVHRISVPDEIDVRAIRDRLGLTQEQFAMRFALPIGSLRNWEQAKRVPHGPARVLLTIIDRIPDEVQVALSKPSKSTRGQRVATARQP